MVPEFIDFFSQVFPSIDPYTREQAKRCMEQFEKTAKPRLTRFSGSDELWQGDVFSEMPFMYYDDDGAQRIIRCKAQLLSNTCDATRDKTLIFAALHPFNDIAGNQAMVDGIKRNKRYSTFYLQDDPVSEEYVDFELINTFSREAFLNLLGSGKVKRMASLTLVGYYMLICKLTVFLLRPEDVEVNASRNYSKRI